MDVDAAVPQVRRIPELWFDDGNVVLQCGSAQYRVYRGILARDSTVFRDMFLVPQPPDAELVDGCPLVHLPDSEVEVTPFLRAIFEPYFFPPFPGKTTFLIIYSCLRLGNKYDAGNLRHNALVYFSEAFGTTRLIHWDVLSYDPSTAGDWRDRDEYTYLICCLQLAREIEATWCLPTIFYSIATAFRNLSTDVFHGTACDGIHGSLSLPDQKAFLTGLDLQTQAAHDLLVFLTQLPAQQCLTPDRCVEVAQAASVIFQDPERPFKHRDPLDVWTSADWPVLDGLCDTCFQKARADHAAARERFWRRLPELYRLPDWNVLRDAKTAALGEDSTV